MSSEIAIKISGLSKVYEIGKEKDGSLRGTLSNIFKSAAASKDEFWALKDLNFDIKKGEVIGIVGKNGAGKSTLLKVLSQITKPSKGKIEINGRVASLLEVGTGFHPELTGRENIYLNGTILGMSRKEVAEKFDEIVEFSGVQKFIETPVKHYSSGMYVRLAFAVAAHLEPEILIIDEVLAVGDAEFQKKCLGKMKDVAGKGRTVIFVSHDMGAIVDLCERAILLRNGKFVTSGNAQKIVNEYLGYDSSSHKDYSKNTLLKTGWDNKANLTSIKIVNSDLQEIQVTSVDETFGIFVEFEVLDATNINPLPNIHISDGSQNKILVAVSQEQTNKYRTVGKHQTVAWIPKNFLNNGIFNIGVAISSFSPVRVHSYDYDALSIEIKDNIESKSRNGFKGKFDSFCRPVLKWDNLN